MTERNPDPPGLAERLLGAAVPQDPAGRSIVGDLREEFVRRARRSASSARRWYWKEACSVAYRRSLDRIFGRSRSPRLHQASRQGDAMLFRMLSDIRFAFRTLRRSRGFTTAAVLTLALGIGANTAIFSVVNGILIRPLPFPNAEEIVGVWHSAPGLGYPQFGSSPGLFFLYQAQSDAFASMGLVSVTELSVSGDGEPERVDGAITTRGLFDVLSVVPIRGRIFSEQETMPDGPKTALISEGFWRRRFAEDPSVLGRTIQVGGVTREIIGVMPEVRLPRDPIELWTPLEVDPAQAAPGSFGPRIVARLKPGATVDQAKQQLDQLIGDRVREQFPNPQFLAFVDAGQLTTIVNPYKEDVVGDLREPLWILLGTVGFVLLIACANVANLFLVRAEARRREMAVRNALGASRGVLVRQYLMESWVLAGLGGTAGLLLAWGGVPLLLRAAPPELPRLNDVRMDLSVLGFALLVSALSAILFGLIPAIRNSSSDLLSALKIAGRGSSTGRDRHLFRSGLVIGQTALALVLLVGSGLLVKSFWELRRVHPGFDAQDVVTFGLTLPQSRYENPSDVAAFHTLLLDRLGGLPGVISAGAAANIPFTGDAAGTAFDIEDKPTTQDELPPITWFTFATPQYFEAMRIPLVSGRTFEPRDHEQGLGTAIVSRSLAERLWPGEEAVGKQLRFAGDTTGWDRVVGVVGSVRDRGLREDASELIYYPMMGRQGNQGFGVRGMGYAVRARNPTALMNSIRATVWALDPELPITSVGTIEGLMEDSIVELSFTTITLVIAAVMAVALGAIGLYGVLAYLVAQRRQEIGVRIALGAQVGEVRRMVVKQGASLAIMGLGVGLVGAFGLTRFLDALLFDTAALDPIAFAATSVALLGVVLLASYLPARRASSVDPVEALRNE